MIELKPDDWRIICQNVTNLAMPIFQIPFSTKLKSEIISSLFEIESAKHYNIPNAKNDTEPDLFFPEYNQPVEIKVTKHKKSVRWMGNKISKRESQFVLIVWDEKNPDLMTNTNGLKFYITTMYLTPDDWTGKDDGYSYHASFLSFNSLKDKNKIDLIGRENILEEYT
jgi:hypothetical protein